MKLPKMHPLGISLGRAMHGKGCERPGGGKKG